MLHAWAGELSVPIPRRNGPALIAHAGGNSTSQVQDAIAASADFVEVDLWVHRGRFEARHERAVYPLPFWFEKWYLRWAPRRPFGLAELFAETAGKTNVFLDIKNGSATAASLLRRALDEAGTDLRVAASSQFWYILRKVNELAPEVALFYSVDVQSKLDLFLSISERDVQPAGVSCRHTLLTKEKIELLHDRGARVVAWTVDDLDRAEQLAEWGVDGLTTHRVADLHQRLASAR
jgi:glycerophosphoryl diester phosphodiesterase